MSLIYTGITVQERTPYFLTQRLIQKEKKKKTIVPENKTIHCFTVETETAITLITRDTLPHIRPLIIKNLTIVPYLFYEKVNH